MQRSSAGRGGANITRTGRSTGGFWAGSSVYVTPRIYTYVGERWAELHQRAVDRADRQDPRTLRGAGVAAWRRYDAVDGPLQTALLALYILVAILPALLVMVEYLETNPAALANHVIHHYDLSSATAVLVRSVLVENRTHELGSALFAVAGALFFGLGFGRVLQVVHARAWGLPLPKRQADQPRYAAVLLGTYGLILLFLFQVKELAGEPAWIAVAVAPGWIALLIAYFMWVPRVLTHERLPWRDLLPGAALTAVGLGVLSGISQLIGQFWVDLYARDYGGLGVIMAIFFWIAISSAVIVVAASLSPALAERRKLRREPAPPVASVTRARAGD